MSVLNTVESVMKNTMHLVLATKSIQDKNRKGRVKHGDI